MITYAKSVVAVRADACGIGAAIDGIESCRNRG
jgi:hypothetical protein